jgi:hypothetical protein
MGDRCYMSVTCRRIDKARFEQLGFQVEYEMNKNSSVIQMVDEEANYAHYDKLPTDIPFIASKGVGSNYGEGKTVCDGEKTVEVGLSHDNSFVVDWNYRLGLPSIKSILQIRRYLKIERRVVRLIKKLEESE